MKNLDDIWNEYIEQESLSPQTKRDLIWHIENDTDPAIAIEMIADMGLKEFAPVVAKQLDNEDNYIREITIACLLGRLQLPEYAEIGLEIAQTDPEDNVRDLATFSIGAVLNLIIDETLQVKIASFLYHMVLDSSQSVLDKGGAYNSILAAMEVPILERLLVRDLGKNIDLDLIEQFRQKYDL
jgi:hypothetical protein